MAETTRDPRKARQFMTRREAEAFARATPGYGPSDAVSIEIMGFHMWAVADHHMNYVARPHGA